MIPQDISPIAKQIPRIREGAENDLPDTMRPLIARLAAHLGELDRHGDELEAQIQTWHRQNAESRRLAAIPGIGPLTVSRPAGLDRGCEDLRPWGNAPPSSGSRPGRMRAGLSRRFWA